MGRRRRAGLLGVIVLVTALVAAACSTKGTSGATPGASTSAPPSTTAGGATTTSTGPSRPGAGPVAAKASTGCGPSAAPAGTTTEFFDVGGMNRSYLEQIPSGATGTTPQPLVVDFHGFSEGAVLHATVSGFGALGEREGFVTVTPQGEGQPAFWDTRPTSPDLTFVRQLLARVEAKACIDRNRVYATGFSNGAFFSSVLACTDADVFAAVAPVAGVRTPPHCHPSRPVPLITFHGTTDQYVSYGGGPGTKAATLPAPDQTTSADPPKSALALLPGPIAESVPAIVGDWARRDGCDPKPVTATVSAEVELLRDACPTGIDVELYRVEGGGHAWPGSLVGSGLDQLLGHTTMTIDATKLIWAFFAAHPLRR